MSATVPSIAPVVCAVIGAVDAARMPSAKTAAAHHRTGGFEPDDRQAVSFPGRALESSTSEDASAGNNFDTIIRLTISTTGC